MRSVLSLIIIVLICSSCSPVSSSWTCKNNLNGSCKNIREIENNYKEDIENKNLYFKDKVSKSSQKNSKNNDNSNISFDDFRSKEKVSRVMFAPYVDEAGNRHDKSIVYYLEQKSDWRK